MWFFFVLLLIINWTVSDETIKDNIRKIILVIWIILLLLFIVTKEINEYLHKQREYLHKQELKKLKYEWMWISKKVIVFDIGKRYVSWDSESFWYNLYRLEAKDENDKIYKSEEFSDEFMYAKRWWRTLKQMLIKYDGVLYDLWKKDESIKQINDNIHRLEMELQDNPWFFKKRELKWDIKAMKKYIDIANEWPITPYLEVNWHKISVWDSIDVFVNPENLNEYYFDLDFTKEK